MVYFVDSRWRQWFTYCRKNFFDWRKTGGGSYKWNRKISAKWQSRLPLVIGTSYSWGCSYRVQGVSCTTLNESGRRTTWHSWGVSSWGFWHWSGTCSKWQIKGGIKWVVHNPEMSGINLYPVIDPLSLCQTWRDQLSGILYLYFFVSNVDILYLAPLLYHGANAIQTDHEWDWWVL